MVRVQPSRESLRADVLQTGNTVLVAHFLVDSFIYSAIQQIQCPHDVLLLSHMLGNKEAIGIFKVIKLNHWKALTNKRYRKMIAKYLLLQLPTIILENKIAISNHGFNIWLYCNLNQRAFLRLF